MSQSSLFSLLTGAFQGRQALRRNLHILHHYILTRSSRKPFLASYKLTYRCNLRCLQCHFYEMQTPEPGFPQVVEVLERLYARGSRIVIFEGGEPTLWRDGQHDISTVVEEARRRFFCVGMTTNGTQPLDVPTDVLWVSIDGFEETHNRLRGRPVFHQVLANIESSPHPCLFAHITVNHQNANEVPKLVRFLADKVKGITVQFYYPYNHQYDLYLDQPARGELINNLLELKTQGYPLLNSSASLQAMQAGGWHCDDWLIDNANPDGSLSQGCYLKGRSDIDCARCGFTPHTEISLAYQGKLDAIRAGIEIFFAS